MKKLFTLVLCAFAAIAVNAKFVVTFSDEGKTATIVSDATDFNSYLNNSNDMVDESGKDVGSQVMNCTKLIFKGKFGGMNAFQNGSSAKIVDMSEAEIIGGTESSIVVSKFGGVCSKSVGVSIGKPKIFL